MTRRRRTTPPVQDRAPAPAATARAPPTPYAAALTAATTANDARPAARLLRAGGAGVAAGRTALANAALAAAHRARAPAAALAVLRALARAGGVPNAETAALAVRACASAGVTDAGDRDPAWARVGARLDVEAVAAGAPVNEALLHARLHLAAGQRDPTGAAAALRAAQERGLPLCDAAVTLAARALSDDAAAVRGLLASFERSEGRPPPLSAFNVLVRAAGRARQPDGVVAALAALRAAGHAPSPSTIKAVVDGLAGHSLDLAVDLVADIAASPARAALGSPFVWSGERAPPRGRVAAAAPWATTRLERAPQAPEYAAVAAAVAAEGGAADTPPPPPRAPVVIDLHTLSKGGAAAACLAVLKYLAVEADRQTGGARRAGVATPRPPAPPRALVVIVGRGPRAVYRAEEAGAADAGLAASVAAFLARIGVRAVPDPGNPGRLVVTPRALAAWLAADAATRAASSAFDARARAAAAAAAAGLGVYGLWAVVPGLL